MTSNAIYMDHASTTAVARDVLEAMAPYFRAVCGNPSSIHSHGAAARQGVERARASVAKLLGCHDDEIHLPAAALNRTTSPFSARPGHWRAKASISSPPQ